MISVFKEVPLGRLDVDEDGSRLYCTLVVLYLTHEGRKYSIQTLVIALHTA